MTRKEAYGKLIDAVDKALEEFFTAIKESEGVPPRDQYLTYVTEMLNYTYCVDRLIYLKNKAMGV